MYVDDGVFGMTIIDITGGDIALHNAVKWFLGEDFGPKTVPRMQLSTHLREKQL